MLIKTKYLVCFKLVLSSVYLTNYKSSGGSLSAARSADNTSRRGTNRKEQSGTRKGKKTSKGHMRQCEGWTEGGVRGAGTRGEGKGGQAK